MSFLRAYKAYFISLLIDLLLALLLVSLFRNPFSEDSFTSDVILYFVVIAIVTIILGIKNGIVALLTSLFTAKDEINAIVNRLIEVESPKPTDWYDIDNPDDYFNDVMNSETASTESRIYAAMVATIYLTLRAHSKFINLFLYSKIMKKALRKYLKYVENNE